MIGTGHTLYWRQQGYKHACDTLVVALRAEKCPEDILVAVEALPSRHLLDQLPGPSREAIENAIIKLEIAYHGQIVIDAIEREFPQTETT